MFGATTIAISNTLLMIAATAVATVDQSSNFVVLLVLFLGSNTVATIAGIWLNNRNARAAQKATASAATLAIKVVAEAKVATDNASAGLLKAQESASEAATALFKAAGVAAEEAQKNGPILAEISETGRLTHDIVNSKSLVVAKRVAALTRIIARAYPNDADAQKEATDAADEVANWDRAGLATMPQAKKPDQPEHGQP
jgi:hypothetical protein